MLSLSSLFIITSGASNITFSEMRFSSSIIIFPTTSKEIFFEDVGLGGETIESL